MAFVRRRPLLRAAAIASGVYGAARRRQQARERTSDEQRRIAALERLRSESAAADGDGFTRSG
jgi:hypothetical protein